MTSSDVLTVSAGPFYEAGCLDVTRITDEDDNVRIEFKNRQGVLVLSRKINKTTNQSYDTYYVYDGFGNLRAVLPPTLSSQIATTGNIDNSLLKKYAYMYWYDVYNRMSAKKLPGVAVVYYAYDGADRIIFSQDGNQRSKNICSFYVYDVFGRECLRGECKKNLDNSGSANISDYSRCYYNGSEDYFGYQVSGISLTSPKILIANFYDNYSFIENSSLNFHSSGYGSPHLFPQGQLTGQIVAKLDGEIPLNYLYSACYYDERNRIIQRCATNVFGKVDVESTKYNFSNQPINIKKEHIDNKGLSHVEFYTYEYDHVGRQTKVMHKYGTSGDVVVIAANTYDELGRLKETKANENSYLKTTYNYNVRSWLTNISNSRFGESLSYNNISSGTKSYNGNISSVYWWTQSSALKNGYVFQYDGLSRLISAKSTFNSAATTNYYNVSVSYDMQGNIMSLIRRGKQDDGTYGEIDHLIYTYNGNQVTHISDSATDPTYNDCFNFVSTMNLVADEYKYDANGNLTKDFNKNISSIEYNCLNLPSKINMKSSSLIDKGTSSIECHYSALGEKLCVVDKKKELLVNPVRSILKGVSLPKDNFIQDSLLIFHPSDSLIVPGGRIVDSRVTYSYCGNYFYEGDSLARVSFDGGYISFTSSGIPKYHFYIKDHLGSVRAVLDANGSVEQYTHYYPFGCIIADKSTNQGLQPYKYNGKELERLYAVNLYDYGARWYDAAMLRWTSVDPLCEQYYETSPYAYCLNNPVKFVDYDGCLTHEYDTNGKLLSNLGGNAIDFIHQYNGDVKIVNTSNGYTNTITRGSRFIKDYQHRSVSTSWLDITKEFLMEKGPKNSLFSDFKGEKKGVFASLTSSNSVYGKALRNDYNSNHDLKRNFVPIKTNKANPYTAIGDIWGQMIGEAALSWYDLGDTILYLLIDSKSNTSLFYHLPFIRNREREENGFGFGNTNQTYIWTEEKK